MIVPHDEDDIGWATWWVGLGFRVLEKKESTREHNHNSNVEQKWTTASDGFESIRICSSRISFLVVGRAES